MLSGRLIRLSANTVEKYTKAIKTENIENLNKYIRRIQNATTTSENISASNLFVEYSDNALEDTSPAREIESSDLKASLINAIDLLLSEKSADIIRRRYGLPPYQNKEQSVISISQEYGVTRGSIYQLEQSALKKLNQHFQSMPG